MCVSENNTRIIVQSLTTQCVTWVIVYANALTRLMVKQFLPKPSVFRSEFTQLFSYTSLSVDILFVCTVRIWTLLNWTTYRAYTARSIDRRSNITLPHLHSARECVGFFFSLDLYKKHHSTRTLQVWDDFKRVYLTYSSSSVYGRHSAVHVCFPTELFRFAFGRHYHRHFYFVLYSLTFLNTTDITKRNRKSKNVRYTTVVEH